MLLFCHYSILYTKLSGPLINLIVKKLDIFTQRLVCLNFAKTAKNRRHGTLTPRPKTSTKSNYEGFYCTVTQKIAYSVKVLEASEATVHAQKETANLLYREIKKLKQEIKCGEASVKYQISDAQ